MDLCAGAFFQWTAPLLWVFQVILTFFATALAMYSCLKVFQPSPSVKVVNPLSLSTTSFLTHLPWNVEWWTNKDKGLTFCASQTCTWDYFFLTSSLIGSISDRIFHKSNMLESWNGPRRGVLTGWWHTGMLKDLFQHFWCIDEWVFIPNPIFAKLGAMVHFGKFDQKSTQFVPNCASIW